MTNEELAVKAKDGDQDALLELWKQNDGLVYVMARRRYARLEADGNTCGVDMDDLKQAVFLALVSAVGYFDPEKDIAFTAYWGNTVKTEFNALLGVRTSKRDPLNTALSLDAPLDDDDPDKGTLETFIPDPKDAYSETEERIWRDQLHAVIDKALSRLPRQEEKVLRLHYYDGLTFTEVSKALGLKNRDVARKLENTAISELLWKKNRDVLSELEDYIDLHTHFYATGSRKRQESPVEISVVRREEMRERFTGRFRR